MRSEYDQAVDALLKKIHAAGYTAVNIDYNGHKKIWTITAKNKACNNVVALLSENTSWRKAFADVREYLKTA